MAVGYSRTATVQVLLDYGADPEVADKEGRTVVDLVEKLRAAMPLTPELLGRRTMLEDVAGVLTGTLEAFISDCLIRIVIIIIKTLSRS
jgi:hypothetical protein